MLDLRISRVGVQVHVLFLQGLSFSTCHDLVAEAFPCLTPKSAAIHAWRSRTAKNFPAHAFGFNLVAFPALPS